MRRSHIVLSCAVAIASTAAMLGNRSGTSAELRGSPLEPTPATSADRLTSPADGGDAAHAALAGRPAEAVRAIAELVDLDRMVLAPGGDHFEAPLKDGRRAILTLDPALQAYAEKLLSQARAPRGAIVAMATDGRILALAGRRAPDDAPRTGTFDWRLATEVWAPAASVFKLVTASALVAAGVDPSDKVCYHGGVRSVLPSNLSDHKRDSRCENLLYGVAHSNNAILGKLAFQKLRPAALTEVAQALGVAAAFPGTDLDGVAGAIEIPANHDLDFAKTAAGFTGSRLSAVGGALLAATFADDGEQPAPRLVASIDGVAQPAPARRRVVTAEVARAVGQMMVATCDFGSAARSFGKHLPIRVAGKTGTLTRNQPFYMEHSWFVGYAPAEQPQIIVSVVLGNAESWHLRGHEAARRLIDRALGRGRASGREKDRSAKISSTKRVGW